MRVGLLLGAVTLAVVGTVMPAQSDTGKGDQLGALAGGRTSGHTGDQPGEQSGEPSARLTTTPVRVVESHQVAGERARVTFSIVEPDRARTVRVESRTTTEHGAPSWQTLRSREVRRGIETLTLRPADSGVRRYRALVSYRGTSWTATTEFTIPEAA